MYSLKPSSSSAPVSSCIGLIGTIISLWNLSVAFIALSSSGAIPTLFPLRPSGARSL